MVSLFELDQHLVHHDGIAGFHIGRSWRWRKEIESERMVAYCLCKVATVGRGYLRNARLYLYEAGSAILILRLI